MRTTALLLRFLLELALLAAAAFLAWTLADGGWRLPLAVLTPVAIAVVWGTFLSPKARVTIPGWARVAFEALLFVGSGYLLWRVGSPTAGAALAVVWVLDRVVLAVTEGTPSALEVNGRGIA